MPVINREDFINSHAKIAICALYCDIDTIHVGIAIKEDTIKIFHFMSGDSIPYEDIHDEKFSTYMFNILDDFPEPVLDSMSALFELISETNNTKNEFFFIRRNVIYDGTKFDIKTGNYSVRNKIEFLVNCGVFVVALLNTFNYVLLEWSSWPNAPLNSNSLENWLNMNNVSAEEKALYYRTNREIRGKHVIICPDTVSKPSHYEEVIPLSEHFIQSFQTI